MILIVKGLNAASLGGGIGYLGLLVFPVHAINGREMISI